MERHFSLRKAAKEIGVDRHTLKLWLTEIAIVLPPVRRGSKVLIRESDLERVMRKRTARSDWSLLRKAG